MINHQARSPPNTTGAKKDRRAQTAQPSAAARARDKYWRIKNEWVSDRTNGWGLSPSDYGGSATEVKLSREKCSPLAVAA